MRALRLLGEVDLIFSEDTRVTRKLLDRYGIKTPMERLDAKVEAKNPEKVLDLLQAGKNIALVTDAGTPGISDPGSILIRKLKSLLLFKLKNEKPVNFSHNELINLISVPGPSSLSASLSVSGLKESHFEFLGFLPHKKGRETLFKKISESKTPVAFFESPHRLMKTLNSLNKHLGKNKKVQVFRELTKIHEETIEGSASEILEYFLNNPDKVKGEIVFIIS